MSMKSLIALAASLLVLTGCVTNVSSTPPPPPAGPNVTGNWALMVETPMGPNNVTATFQQANNTLSGKIANDRGETQLTGTIEKTAINFSITIDAQGTTLKIEYSGEVTGDTMAGTVKFGDFGEGKWTGKKNAS
jgi:aerobic carbon-monoxide dehydrogenase large subunit